MIKAIIFDFDNTLEEWLPVEYEVGKQVASLISKKYNLNEKKFLKEFDNTRHGKYFTMFKPTDESRKLWFHFTLKEFGIKDSGKRWEDEYWKRAIRIRGRSNRRRWNNIRYNK